MNHLIVYSHPNPKSFNHAILEAYSNALKEAGHDVRIRDLYEIGFDPILKADDFLNLQAKKVADDLRVEQFHVAWADVITFIYPLWWAGMPAIAKGYLDRVFSEGFAYRFDEKGHHRLLSDKSVLTITTIGDSDENYRTKGFYEAMDRLMDGITFDFSGLKVLGHRYFGSVPWVTDADRKAMLEEVRAVAASFSRP